jgi:hypothetical protein
MRSLPEIQAGFAAALRGDTASGAADVAGNGLTATGRLRIYQHNSRAMFEGALERSYPVLRRRVGGAYFSQLAHGYRQRYPSRSGDLHWVGEHFPEHLSSTQAGTGYEWLAELAALEWACETSLVAARSRPVGAEALSGLTADEIGGAALQLQRSLRCIASAVPVLDVWRANQPDADGRPIDLSKGPQCVLVSCGETGLELREVGATMLEFTRLLQQGVPLGEALDRSGLPIESVAGALGLLFEAGLVAAVSHPAVEQES